MLGFSINRVAGDSMSPLLPADSYVLFHRYYNTKKLKVGAIVKVAHPKYGDIVKTITYKDSNGLFWLKGESKESVSTLEMGPVSKEKIIGVSCLKILPP